MKRSIKKQWAEDLESGEFVQGKGRLHHKGDDGVDTYCCLGVLCFGAAREELEAHGFRIVEEYEGHMQLKDSVNAASTLDLSVGALRVLGISDQDQTRLIVANDGTFKDFRAIARMVRALKVTE